MEDPGQASKCVKERETVFEEGGEVGLNTSVGCGQAYDNMAFREAVKVGYYDLQSARDRYRFAVGPHGMHADVALKYIEVSSLPYSARGHFSHP